MIIVICALAGVSVPLDPFPDLYNEQVASSMAAFLADKRLD